MLSFFILDLLFETGCHYIIQTGLELFPKSKWPQAESPGLSISQVLGSQVDTAKPGFFLNYFL